MRLAPSQLHTSSINCPFAIQQQICLCESAREARELRQPCRTPTPPRELNERKAEITHFVKLGAFRAIRAPEFT
ncbi:hypothetical protein Y032_0009g583 [Ancylostoma ceylanicum]|uniref:Uncharacterized protein n=1 Tax=Ancylostoma ceylanicum TaxID=53326 RepID=A0A016VKC7_9BILA|nr:hypothetical protein Y032_0009g583 [Ancylostoma ceylanicum]